MKQRGWADRRGMGAQSDFISEQFVPSERYNAQQRAMAEALIAAGLNPCEFDSLSTPEETARMGKQKLPPHLISYQGAQRCSICKMPFARGAKPSADEAFSEHVIKAHRPGQTNRQ